MGDIVGSLLLVLIFILGVVLILLVLIQRGRGGGLSGALGGAGGSSPFGSRAGDTFTRATLIIAIAWIILNMVEILWIAPPAAPPPGGPPPDQSVPTE